MTKVSDNKLRTLWSKAVIAKYKRCPLTGATDGLQSHHIIPKGRQNRFALRWDIRNGVPLRADIHRKLHDGDLRVVGKLLDYVEERGDMEYLMELKHMLKHDFLSKHLGMTEEEYRVDCKRQLEYYIREA